MRFDDALCAINTLNGGALIGGGITLLKISDKLEENNEGDKIIKQTLTKPFEILIESVGLNSETIEIPHISAYESLLEYTTYIF